MALDYRVIAAGSDLHARQQALREAVLRAPLGRVLTAAERAADARGALFAAVQDGAVVGSAILFAPDGGFPQPGGAARLRQMATAPDWRGRGVGAGLLRYAEDWARARGVARIVLHARLTARGFYERLDYEARGDAFDEDGVAHIVMEKDL